MKTTNQPYEVSATHEPSGDNWTGYESRHVTEEEARRAAKAAFYRAQSEELKAGDVVTISVALLAFDEDGEISDTTCLADAVFRKTADAIQVTRDDL